MTALSGYIASLADRAVLPQTSPPFVTIKILCERCKFIPSWVASQHRAAIYRAEGRFPTSPDSYWEEMQ